MHFALLLQMQSPNALNLARPTPGQLGGFCDFLVPGTKRHPFVHGGIDFAPAKLTGSFGQLDALCKIYPLVG